MIARAAELVKIILDNHSDEWYGGFMKKYTEGEVLKVLREQFAPAHGATQTQEAAKLGFSVQYIQAVLSQGRIPKAVAEALGYHPEPTTYAKKGASR
jgi:hypothetical protein